MSDSNPPDPADDEAPRSDESAGEAPPTGDVIEAEEGGTQEPLDGP